MGVALLGLDKVGVLIQEILYVGFEGRLVYHLVLKVWRLEAKHLNESSLLFFVLYRLSWLSERASCLQCRLIGSLRLGCAPGSWTRTPVFAILSALALCLPHAPLNVLPFLDFGLHVLGVDIAPSHVCVCVSYLKRHVEVISRALVLHLLHAHLVVDDFLEQFQ